MIPTDEVKEDSAIDTGPSVNLWDTRWGRIALVVLLGLVVSVGLMVWKLVYTEQVKAIIPTPPPAPTRTTIVSSKDLEAYTLVTNNDLMPINGTNDTPDPRMLEELLDKLRNRYLLTNVPQGAEIKSEMLAPSEATEMLGNSVAVSIPATATATLGNQLRVGHMIDLLAIPGNQPSANQSDQPKLHVFEKLLVLNIPIKKDPKVDEKDLAEAGAITLALPTKKRDEFASAIAGATVVITRRVPVQ
jgi:Flp pilus assembly protein CpaB